MIVRVSTTLYKASHGKSPRGHGMWAFQIRDDVIWYAALYSKAKAWAVTEARAAGTNYVEVLP